MDGGTNAEKGSDKLTGGEFTGATAKHNNSRDTPIGEETEA